MATATRIYLVTAGAEKRLVRAANKVQAVNHVARATIEAEVADQETLLTMAMNGAVKVETAGEHAQAADPD